MEFERQLRPLITCSYPMRISDRCIALLLVSRPGCEAGCRITSHESKRLRDGGLVATSNLE